MLISPLQGEMTFFFLCPGPIFYSTLQQILEGALIVLFVFQGSEYSGYSNNDLTMFSYIVHPNWNLSNPFPNQLMSPIFPSQAFQNLTICGFSRSYVSKKSLCLSSTSSCTITGQDYLGLVLRVSSLSSILSFVGITCYLVLMQRFS